MQHLVEDHSSVDPTYVEDFLLSFRTFLPSPMLLANQLLQWFESPIYKPKVSRQFHFLILVVSIICGWYLCVSLQVSVVCVCERLIGCGQFGGMQRI